MEATFIGTIHQPHFFFIQKFDIILIVAKKITFFVRLVFCHLLLNSWFRPYYVKALSFYPKVSLWLNLSFNVLIGVAFMLRICSINMNLHVYWMSEHHY